MVRPCHTGFRLGLGGEVFPSVGTTGDEGEIVLVRSGRRPIGTGDTCLLCARQASASSWKLKLLLAEEAVASAGVVDPLFEFVERSTGLR